jgi:hypothetical protein
VKNEGSGSPVKVTWSGGFNFIKTFSGPLKEQVQIKSRTGNPLLTGACLIFLELIGKIPLKGPE